MTHGMKVQQIKNTVTHAYYASLIAIDNTSTVVCEYVIHVSDVELAELERS